MGNLWVPSGDGGAKEAYQAAKEIRATQNSSSEANAQAVRDAALAAAQQDGVITGPEEAVLSLLEKDPDAIDSAREDKNGISFSSPEQSDLIVLEDQVITTGKASKEISFIDNTVTIPEVVIELPEKSFRREFNTNSTYIPPNNPQLTENLKAFADYISDNKGAKETIIKGAKNEHRAGDFLWALEKAQNGQKLDSDDIENIQKFLSFDADNQDILSYDGDSNGVDGKYGYRTHLALGAFMEDLRNSIQ